MYRYNRASFAILTAACVLSLAACNKMKNDNKADNEDTGYATEHAMLEKTFSDAQSISDEAGTSGSLSNYRMISGNSVLGNCATVTNDTSVNPHTLAIDFGATNCLCADGIYRRGKILVSYTGRYKDAGHAHTTSFDNYYVNDNGVTGTKTVTNMGTDASGNPTYNISVSGAIVLANGNGTVSWNSTRTRTWLSGYNTPSWKDDVYGITGNGTVTRANGKTFDMNITTPLHVALDCRWIESGVVQITPQSGNVRTLDYGSGVCDAQANYTVNGKTYSVTLK
jgi:hypothetical protein